MNEIEGIETPALVVDLDAMERNLDLMAAFARERGLGLRPHAKTHKSAWIAHQQTARGAVGVCVQKTAEAEALAAQGVADIFITNEVIDSGKLSRVAALARRVRLAIAVDSRLGIERLAAALRAVPAPLEVYVEIDVGHGRCGIAPAESGLLARALREAGLHCVGLQAYHGSAQHRRTPAERATAIEGAAAAVRVALGALAREGFGSPRVTGAGSGTFALEAASGLWHELQCGSYVFMDRDYADNEVSPGVLRFEHALFVKSQVTSRGDGHAVIDAGHKSHALDSGPPLVWGCEDLVWANGGDEHGLLRPAAGVPTSRLPSLGETVWLVPGHCDPTVNLHDTMVGVRGGLVQGRVERVIRIDARGALR